jgi:hypothetical protein
MIAIIKRAKSSIVDKYYPSKANHEKMSLHSKNTRLYREKLNRLSH